MYKRIKASKSTIVVNTSYPGERIEEKVNRIVNNKEPIKDGAPLIYTDRSDGVQAQYNIRTDRFELAIDAMDKVTKDKLSKREQRQTAKKKSLGEEAIEGMKKEGQKDGGAESVAGSAQ